MQDTTLKNVCTEIIAKLALKAPFDTLSIYRRVPASYGLLFAAYFKDTKSSSKSTNLLFAARFSLDIP